MKNEKALVALLALISMVAIGCGKDPQGRSTRPKAPKGMVQSEQLVSESAPSASVIGLADRYETIQTESPKTKLEDADDGCQIGRDFKRALTANTKSGKVDLIESTEAVQMLQGKIIGDNEIAKTAAKIMVLSEELTAACDKRATTKSDPKQLAKSLISLSYTYRKQMRISKTGEDDLVSRYLQKPVLFEKKKEPVKESPFGKSGIQVHTPASPVERYLEELRR